MERGVLASNRRVAGASSMLGRIDEEGMERRGNACSMYILILSDPLLCTPRIDLRSTSNRQERIDSKNLRGVSLPSLRFSFQSFQKLRLLHLGISLEEARGTSVSPRSIPGEDDGEARRGRIVLTVMPLSFARARSSVTFKLDMSS